MPISPDAYQERLRAYRQSAEDLINKCKLSRPRFEFSPADMNKVEPCYQSVLFNQPDVDVSIQSGHVYNSNDSLTAVQELDRRAPVFNKDGLISVGSEPLQGNSNHTYIGVCGPYFEYEHFRDLQRDIMSAQDLFMRGSYLDKADKDFIDKQVTQALLSRWQCMTYQQDYSSIGVSGADRVRFGFENFANTAENRDALMSYLQLGCTAMAAFARDDIRLMTEPENTNYCVSGSHAMQAFMDCVTDGLNQYMTVHDRFDSEHFAEPDRLVREYMLGAEISSGKFDTDYGKSSLILSPRDFGFGGAVLPSYDSCSVKSLNAMLSKNYIHEVLPELETLVPAMRENKLQAGLAKLGLESYSTYERFKSLERTRDLKNFGREVSDIQFACNEIESHGSDLQGSEQPDFQ